ncbi:metalloprotease 1 precursor [Aphelenchoides avenae]|nr:metalloprotease 1 precursor [Aphelenchus avenae]
MTAGMSVRMLPTLAVLCAATFVASVPVDVKNRNEKRQKFMQEIAHDLPPQLSEPILEKAYKARAAPRIKFPPLPPSVEEALKAFGVDFEKDRTLAENFLQSIPVVNSAFGDLLYEGDMILSKEQLAANNGTAEEGRYPDQSVSAEALDVGREKRQVQTGNGYPRNKWTPGTPIAYRFDSSIDSSTRDIIRYSFKFWEQNTCLSFQENGNNQPRIRFFKGQGCYSLVGKAFTQSEQELSIGDGCETFGTVTHEIGHALGMFHHHSRSDRDSFISVLTQNLRPGWDRQFAKVDSSMSSNLNVHYDYGSVMHYTAYDPSTQKVMFLAKDKRYQHTMGNNYGPVFSDLLLMNRYYKCTDKCGSGKCKNGGFPHPRNCNSCICPNGFGGSDCSQRAAGEGGAPSSCGKTVQASAQPQTLSGSAQAGSGSGPQRISLRQAGCHYHIRAPAGQRVELKFQRVSGTCTQECALGGTEVKYDHFTRVGAHLCCPSHVSSLGTVTTAGNLAVISAYSQRGENAFTVQYRAVGGSGSSSPGTSGGNRKATSGGGRGSSGPSKTSKGSSGGILRPKIGTWPFGGGR